MSAEVELNADQQAAEEGFFKFLFSSKSEMGISGAGGTGKTFLLGHLIDRILPKYKQMAELVGMKADYDEVVFTATTNKAAEVMAQATGRPCQTIHSFLHLTVYNDNESGKSQLKKTKNWEIHCNKIIVIDESGMIDYPLLQLLREGTHKCKIIFLGDHCQLAPVGEPFSSVWNSSIEFHKLTIPMRATEPALLDLCARLRHTVETGEFGDLQLVPGIVDHYDAKQMQNALDTLFIEKHHNNRILCYTNARAVKYNEYIRGIRQIPELYAEGEELVNTYMCRIGRDRISVEQEVTIAKRHGGKEITLLDGSTLDCVLADLSLGYGGNLYYVPLPADRDHFDSLVKYYRKQKLWKMYFHLLESFPDLRPKDSSTTHKAQGSTFDDVYIDIGDLSTCRNPRIAAQLLYVAVSRARKRVIFYGDLAPKYGRLVN